MIFEMNIVRDRLNTKLSLGCILITPNVICITTNFKEKVYVFCSTDKAYTRSIWRSNFLKRRGYEYFLTEQAKFYLNEIF